MERAINKYTDYLQALKRSEKDISNTAYSLGLFSTFVIALGVNDVSELNNSHIESWFLSQRKRTNSKGMPLKAGSINNDLVKLKGFLKYLYKRDQIKSKLYDKVESLKQPRLLPTSLLSDEEMSTFLDTFDVTTPSGFRNKTMTCLMYSTGMRVGELCGLDIDDVNFDDSTALVFGKGSKERLVPIGKSVLLMLQSYVKAIRPFFMKKDDDKSLFYSFRGDRISVTAVQRMFKKMTTEAGFTNITPHSMRRSFATVMIKSNANIYHVKEIMGHEGLDQLKHYVRLNISDLKKTHKKCHPRG